MSEIETMLARMDERLKGQAEQLAAMAQALSKIQTRSQQMRVDMATSKQRLALLWSIVGAIGMAVLGLAASVLGGQL